MASAYEAHEHTRPLFKLTLSVAPRKSVAKPRDETPKKHKKHHQHHKKRHHKHRHSSAESASLDTNDASHGSSTGILVFDPPLPEFPKTVLKCMRQMCDDSLSQWRVVNVDMFLPYDGSKTRDHRGTFYATNDTRKSPLGSEDPLFLAAAQRASSALRRSTASVMALVLVLQRYAEFFHFDSSNFSKGLKQINSGSGKRQSGAKEREPLPTPPTQTPTRRNISRQNQRIARVRVLDPSSSSCCKISSALTAARDSQKKCRAGSQTSCVYMRSRSTRVHSRKRSSETPK